MALRAEAQLKGEAPLLLSIMTRMANHVKQFHRYHNTPFVMVLSLTIEFAYPFLVLSTHSEGGLSEDGLAKGDFVAESARKILELASIGSCPTLDFSIR